MINELVKSQLGEYIPLKSFYIAEKLIQAGIEVLIPDEDNIELINDVIYNELCLRMISTSLRKTTYVLSIRWARNHKRHAIECLFWGNKILKSSIKSNVCYE